MKLILKSILVSTFITSNLVAVYAENNLLKMDPEDLNTFENTHSCMNCNLVGVSNIELKSNFKDFSGSVLTGSDISYGILGIYMWDNSNFDNAILIQTHLTSIFDGSSFKSANMQEASFSYGSFNHVSFVKANLSNALLQNVSFHYSDFTNATLNGANLYNTDLCNATITQEQILSSSNYACAMKPDCSGRYPNKDGTPCT